MASYPCSILQLVAATAIAAALCTATPAVAAESSATIGKAGAAATKTEPSRAARIAASYYGRHFRPSRGHLDCSGVWCGRQFVLIVGIAY